MRRRIVIDGIRVEGTEAKRIVNEVLRDADEAGAPRRRVPLAMLVGAVALAGGAAALARLVLRRVAASLAEGWIALICMAIAFVVSAAWVHVHLRRHRRELRQAMRRRGFELCPSCGYWLKGLEGDRRRCPECGAERATETCDRP